MFRISIPVAALLGALLLVSSLEAQNVPDSEFLIPPEGYVQIIALPDGSSLVGQITRVTPESVTFATGIGALDIPRAKIQSIRTVPQGSMRKGEYRFPDPNASRLFFSPTGRMLPRGEGYVADYYLFFPTVNYGVTDRLSLGGGLSILPTGNLSDQVYYFTPKFGISQSDRFNLAAGALVVKFPSFEDDNGDTMPLLSVLYGVGTWGGPERSVTLALGYGMADTDLADRPLIVLGAEQRITPRFAFVTENWMVPEVDDILLSFGVRFLTEKFTTDFALLNPAGPDAFFPGVPYIDFVYFF